MTKMNTHALVNINLLYKHAQNDDMESIKLILESYLISANRKFVFNDQEILLMLSSLLNEISTSDQNDIADKMTAALWNQSKDILETHGVIR